MGFVGRVAVVGLFKEKRFGLFVSNKVIHGSQGCQWSSEQKM